jgi:hypothetical protein
MEGFEKPANIWDTIGDNAPTVKLSSITPPPVTKKFGGTIDNSLKKNGGGLLGGLMSGLNPLSGGLPSLDLKGGDAKSGAESATSTKTSNSVSPVFGSFNVGGKSNEWGTAKTLIAAITVIAIVKILK